MSPSLPYTVENSLSGKVIQPDRCEVYKFKDGYMVRMFAQGLVFRHPQTFSSYLEASRFGKVTMREGAKIL
jgi:hypothetical protein